MLGISQHVKYQFEELQANELNSRRLRIHVRIAQVPVLPNYDLR